MASSALVRNSPGGGMPARPGSFLLATGRRLTPKLRASDLAPRCPARWDRFRLLAFAERFPSVWPPYRLILSMNVRRHSLNLAGCSC
jgi:hypothetical protein